MIIDLINSILDRNQINRMSRRLGADESTVESAVSSAIPLLLGAMNRNAGGQTGAASLFSALERDHDGSILDNLDTFFSGSAAGSGSGILKHLLGGRRSTVEQELAGRTGLDAGSIGKLLTFLAPLVMGAVGKVQRAQGFDSAGLSAVLRSEMDSAAAAPKADLGLLSLLDSDQDGDIVDDVARLGGSFLGKMFNK